MSHDDDFETLLELTAQLQLQDIEEWRASQKGKHRMGFVSDAELSLSAIEAHHKNTLQTLLDRRVAQSVQRAIREDQNLLDALAATEEQERADHQLALRLASDLNDPLSPSISAPTFATPSRASSVHSLPGVSSPRSTASYTASITSSILDQVSVNSSRTSINSAYKPSTNTSTFVPSILKLAGGRITVDCIICGDTVTQAYQAPCGCFYDRGCLTDLFEKATVDESLFPPRCCNQQISFQAVRTIFSPQLIRTFEQKAEEYKTTNRLYCHNPVCSAFIGPAVGNEREKTNQQCTQCHLQTCSFCKGPGHASHFSCRGDVGAEQVLALGRREGWQSCPSCHNMVELMIGCYHMTCRCRYEFCYLCAQRWKNCNCRQWDEPRLLEEANRQVTRARGVLTQTAAPGQVAARSLQIQQVARALRENHRCAHHTHGFIKQNSQGNCESCGGTSNFLLRCRGCAIQVCVHCRRNRL